MTTQSAYFQAKPFDPESLLTALQTVTSVPKLNWILVTPNGQMFADPDPSKILRELLRAIPPQDDML